jgi:putative restriction endonuclease
VGSGKHRVDIARRDHRLCDACPVDSAPSEASRVLDSFASLRQHQHDGQRSPHKPLLVLLALGRLAATGSSELPWSVAESQLAALLTEFGPPSRTSRAQSAAYPFTRLRTDGVWVLDADVQMDLVGPLATQHVSGRFEASMESALRSDPALVRAVARALVLTNFPETVAPDVLAAAGLDADVVLTSSGEVPVDRHLAGARRRDAGWRSAVLQAWDRQCAFCGYDGQLAGASAGIDAAHVRWFTFDGPDDLDNGLALCVLHHKLFDLGALGLSSNLQVQVSGMFTARTPAGRAVYELHGLPLTPRPGTIIPSAEHLTWHARQVFKGQPLAA